MYSIKTPKDANVEEFTHFSKKLFEIGSKLDHQKFLLNNSSMMHPGNKSCKVAQSRNITNSLMNVKSQGANIDHFSFIRPQSMKGDQNCEGRQRKQKSKKGKPTKKMPYEDIKEKLLENYNMKARVIRTALDERSNVFTNPNKSAYK